MVTLVLFGQPIHSIERHIQQFVISRGTTAYESLYRPEKVHSGQNTSVIVKNICCKDLLYTEYTQKNGAVSMVNKGKPHHYFVYTLYIYI